MAKILLVEDNEMNRDMLSRRLGLRGYTVVMAMDGESGVRMAVSEIPDLILMDMSLPVLDGWGATQRIRADQALKGIPIIALTGYATAQDEQLAMDAGCDDFDTKPVDFPGLLAKVKVLLGRAAVS